MILTIGQQLLIALQAASAVDQELPVWLQGIWDRDDIYVMDPSQDGEANDGLTASTSWPNIVRYPCKARTSATYPSPNGTRAYPDGVKVIVFLPGDYSMRKMHSARVEELYPHFDVNCDSGLEPTVENPLILVYAGAADSYAGMATHPKLRDEDHQADMAVVQFGNEGQGLIGPVYVHGIRSSVTAGAPYGGIFFSGIEAPKAISNWVETSGSHGIRLAYDCSGAEIGYNYCERPYPWSYSNDYAGILLGDGPHLDVHVHDNVVLNYADAAGANVREHLYRQDPITINITGAGSGYAVGDALAFGTGTTTVVYTHAIGRVTAVDGGGGITAVECSETGGYEGGYPSVTVTSGGGTGATLTCTALAGPRIKYNDNSLYNQTFTANAGTDIITFAVDVPSCKRVYLSSTGTLPAGLSAGYYWVVRQSATTAKVASSYANAVAGTIIDITDAGSGTHTLSTPDVWEMGWTEVLGYGALAGLNMEYNYFGCTDAVKVSNVYDTIYGIENCLDFKCGGTALSPARVHHNYLFGIRANGGSYGGAITLHDALDNFEFDNNVIADCGAGLFFQIQYYRDRLPNDGGSTGGTAYPALEDYLTVNVHDNLFCNIEDFATTASYADYQGRVILGTNIATFQDNSLVQCDYLAADVKNPSYGDDWAFGGNLVHETIDKDAWSAYWTDGTISSGYTLSEEIVTIPWTDYTITVHRMIPN